MNTMWDLHTHFVCDKPVSYTHLDVYKRQIYIIHGKEELSNDNYVLPQDVNDENVAELYFYIFAFCNVSYHTDFSNDLEIVLYYKNIPLFSSSVECIDEGRTKIIPPAYWNDAYYIKNTMDFLLFKFVFNKMGENYSSEAQDMLLRVIPVYKSEEEYLSLIHI